MSKSWPTVKLGEVLRLDLDRVALDAVTSYPMVGVLSFGHGLFHRPPVENGKTSYRAFYRLNAQHVVMSQLFGWEGALALSSEEFAGGYLSPQFPTFLCDQAKLDRQYLGWLMRRPVFWNDLGSRARGMGDRRRTLTPEALFDCDIPLPTLAEQRRVVVGIEELAAKIEEAKQLRRQAAEEAEALRTHGASTILDRLANTHPVRPLAELVKVHGGGTPSKSVPFYWEGTIPWITPKDMKRRELNDAIDHISERATQETAAKLIQPGAVLVVVRGMILAHTFPSAVLRASAAINQDMKALIPKKDLLPEFLCALFWGYNSRVLDVVEKSTHDTRRLETGKLLGTKVIFPPIFEQHRIVAELDALQAKVDALKRLQAETAAELDALLPSILNKAFKGEL